MTSQELSLVKQLNKLKSNYYTKQYPYTIPSKSKQKSIELEYKILLHNLQNICSHKTIFQTKQYIECQHTPKIISYIIHPVTRLCKLCAKLEYNNSSEHSSIIVPVNHRELPFIVNPSIHYIFNTLTNKPFTIPHGNFSHKLKYHKLLHI